MVGLRKILFPLLTDRPYQFFGQVFRESFYEYRKDLGTYFLMVTVIYAAQELYRQQSELAELRANAKATGKIVLKSGARQIRILAAEFLHAQAAGNYVDVFTSFGQILARTSLSGLQQQLEAAGGDVRRVHRTRLVDFSAVKEILPVGSGDLELVLVDGTKLRASRRYRDKLKLDS
jgi:DNA-binding LytR/AlgR family response regulator